uniref:Putative non-specific lipid-transfer protein-like n=1 Tax=Davidia involucrata TaxID=16924 RepID=A0A5B7A5Q1_DAVIN
MANSTQLKSDALMEQMKLHLATDTGKELTKKIGLVYQINIAPKKIGFNEEIYVVDLKKGEVTKGPYEGGKPDATFSFKDEDFLKVKGSLSAAQKFTPDIFPKPSKM